MNKKELIMAIIDLVDENAKLKIENEILLKQKLKKKCTLSFQ